MSYTNHAHQAGAFAMQRREWLLAHARNTCRNDIDAEDLVQECLLRFIQKFLPREDLPGERVCETWLLTTLSHLFFDQCRRRRVREQGAIDPHTSEATLAAPEPADPTRYDAITDEQFTQALQSLSPKMRATFELHAAGKKYQDIARSLDIPVGTVSKRLHDARARLRELLADHPPPRPN